MYGGDRFRKHNLVNMALDYLLLLIIDHWKFDEFQRKLNQVVFVSATPSTLESL